MSVDAERDVHLVEVGVRWPPETFVGWKLEGLADFGWRVTVVSATVLDPDARLRGVELLALPPGGIGRRAARRRALRMLLRSPRRLARLLGAIARMAPEDRARFGGFRGCLGRYLPLAELRPDVVQFEWTTAAAEHLPLFGVWQCPVAIACRGSDTSVHPHDPARVHYRRLLPRVLAAVDAAHCVAEWQAREVVELGLDPAKVRLIRPSVDPRRFRPADRRPQAPAGTPLRVLSVGWLRWMKGYEYAVLAMRELADRRVPAVLEIVGGHPRAETSEIGRIELAVADLDLGGRVRVLGQLDTDTIAARLRASDVFLHSSVSEGTPVAIIEAMASGVPVVTTDCGGAAEAVRDGVEGLVVGLRDPSAIATALERLWREPELRERMALAGPARVAAEYTLWREIVEFEAMYSELIAA